MLVVSLLACTLPKSGDACARFDEMELTDPDGVASDNDRTRVRTQVDDMATATGLDGVCVPEVRFVPDGTCGEENCYQGPGEPILIDSSTTWLVRPVLCEALADTLGRSGADFLETCASYPATLALMAEADASCDLEVSPGDARAFMDDVFPAWDVVIGEPVDLTLERHGVTGLADALGSFVSSGDAFYAWEGTGAIVKIDPVTFAVDARYTLPERPDSSIRRMIPTEGEPILVYSGSTTLAWRLVEGAWVTVDFAALEEGSPFYGAASGERAWVLGYDATGAAGMTEVDLSTGASTPLAGPSLRSADFLAGHADRLVGGAATALLEQSMVVVDPEAGTYETVPTPYDWHTWAPVPIGDRVAVAWSTGSATSVAIYDPETSAWHFASDPCGEAQLRSGVWPTVRGEEAWLAESDEDAPGGMWMTEIVVGP